MKNKHIIQIIHSNLLIPLNSDQFRYQGKKRKRKKALPHFLLCLEIACVGFVPNNR